MPKQFNRIQALATLLLCGGIVLFSACSNPAPSPDVQAGPAPMETPAAEQSTPTPTNTPPQTVQEVAAYQKQACLRDCRYDEGGDSPGCHAVCDCIAEKLGNQLTQQMWADYQASLKGAATANPAYTTLLAKINGECAPLRYQ